MGQLTLSTSDTDAAYNKSTKINGNSTIVARQDLLCCDLTDGAVILDLHSGVYYGLDDVGTFVWALIQEPRAFKEITSAILEEYSVDSERCLKDLINLFAEMKQRNLIDVRNGHSA